MAAGIGGPVRFEVLENGVHQLVLNMVLAETCATESAGRSQRLSGRWCERSRTHSTPMAGWTPACCYPT